jgi:hypothetical protein
VILGTFGSFAYLSIRKAQAAHATQAVTDEGPMHDPILSGMA